MSKKYLLPVSKSITVTAKNGLIIFEAYKLIPEIAVAGPEIKFRWRSSADGDWVDDSVAYDDALGAKELDINGSKIILSCELSGSLVPSLQIELED